MGDKEFYKEGYYLSLDNAQCLLNTSKKAAEMRDFGVASSLNILAAEESLKALFLITKSQNLQGKIANFDKVFQLHKVKHEELKSVIEFQDKIIAETLKFLRQIEPHLELFEKLSHRYEAEQLALLNEIKDDYEWFENASKRKLNLEGILRWLDNANNNKNKGLYVDKKGSRWQSPKDITEAEYKQGEKYSELIFEHVKWLDIFYARVDRSKK